MADHDQRFKTTLKEFFPEKLTLFHPVWARRFDLSRIEWLEQEIFSDPPEGQRQVIDLVARLPLREEIAAQRPRDEATTLALLLTEIESGEGVGLARPRMYEYYDT